MSQSSIEAIQDFKQYKKILNKPMKEITVCAKVLKDGLLIFDDEVKISFSVNVWNSEINIEWNLNDNALRSLGLHKGYNTSYQQFSFSEGILYMVDDDFTLSFE